VPPTLTRDAWGHAFEFTSIQCRYTDLRNDVRSSLIRLNIHAYENDVFIKRVLSRLIDVQDGGGFDPWPLALGEEFDPFVG